MLGILLTLLAFAQFVDKRYETSLLIFFGLITNGFQIVPPSVLLAGSPVEKPSDLAIFYVLAVVVYRFDAVRRLIRNEQVFRWVLAFLAFTLVDALYSYCVLDYNFVSVIKMFRNYPFLLSFGVFVTVPVPILMRVVQKIGIITIIQCGLYLAQIPTGITLLLSASAGSEVTTNNMQNIGFTRFYNTPIYLTPILFYYLTVHQFRSRANQIAVLGVLMLTVVGPLHRSYMMSLFAVLALNVLFRQASSKRLMYLSGLAIMGYAAMLIDVISYRVNEALLDLGKTFSGSLVTVDQTENTFSYRIAHFLERFDYVMKLPNGWLWGLGMLHEETPQAAKLSFIVGSNIEKLDRVSQTQTADILWSLLILQVGIVGSILFLVVMTQFIRFLNKNHRVTPYATVALLWMVLALINTVSGVEMGTVPFRVLILLFLVMVAKMAYQPAKQRSDAEKKLLHA